VVSGFAITLKKLYIKMNELEARVRYLESIVLNKDFVRLKEVLTGEAISLP
jgi:hypothetical protein